MTNNDKDKAIASHASEILGTEITPEDIKDRWVELHVELSNINYRLDIIEEILGIAEGYTLDAKDISELILKKSQQLNKDLR